MVRSTLCQLRAKKNSLLYVNFLFSICVSVFGQICLVLVLLLFSNCKQMFSIISKSNIETCQVFCLDRIANWSYCSESATADQTTNQPKTYYNTVLLQYVLMPARGHSLHFRTNVRLPERAYLMFLHEDVNFRVFEFDSEFDKTPKNQRFSHFQFH